MVNCKYCGAQMTSAPSHMDHEETCLPAMLWRAINAYVEACGGDPLSPRRAVDVARAEIDRLVPRPTRAPGRW